MQVPMQYFTTFRSKFGNVSPGGYIIYFRENSVDLLMTIGIWDTQAVTVTIQYGHGQNDQLPQREDIDDLHITAVEPEGPMAGAMPSQRVLQSLLAHTFPSFSLVAQTIFNIYYALRV
jgi:hypothetical protein